MRKPQKESLKLAEAGLCALRKEMIPIRRQSGAAGADVDAVVRDPGDAARTAGEGACAEQQMLGVDRTPFHWKTTPAWSSIAGKKPEDKRTPSLGAHAAGW